MTKAKITRTFGPIHFEDLEPKRFEDLVRELIYDFKDWKTIEATGRSGDDSGFDIRAYEKNNDNTQESESEDESEENPMGGNLWMIQCKREKVIGPTKVKEILKDVDVKNPPYGYILAASANFSKSSYDMFRSELKEKGVMEFYLWGKAELEDKLHLPKNDRILFTFFGISLTSKKRSRTTEIRFVVNTKNKTHKIIGDEPNGKIVLVRDAYDEKYPYSISYKDFDINPRWKKYRISETHPLGLILESKRHYAYIDTIKKEYYIFEDILLNNLDEDELDESQKVIIKEKKDLLQNLWEHLPICNQGAYVKNGLIKYEDILCVDSLGDGWNKYPHVFTNFTFKNGPFSGFVDYIESQDSLVYLRDYKKIDVFAKKNFKHKIGIIYENKNLNLETFYLHRLNHGSADFNTLYDTSNKLNFLKVGDIVGIDNPENKILSKNYIKITHIETTSFKDYLLKYPHRSRAVEEMLKAKPKSEDLISYYEFKPIYEWEFKKV